ncbi:MAG: glycosyltransferase [Vicinamibacterales bacterium]
MKVAVVAQRYGADINGGAELHARYIAERLGRHVDVEVLTTCARDYVTWRNEIAPGTETINGVTVRRFPVARERDPGEFGRWSDRVFTTTHSLKDELAWLDAEGPTSPALVKHLKSHEADFDFFLFFSVRYYHAYHGARAVPGKAILVPTAERDGALGLGIFPPVFRGVRALMYNSYEERALIQGVSGNHDVPGVVVGVGSEIPDRVDPDRFRRKFGLAERFAIYVGRIDENKGCRELFDFFTRYSRLYAEGPHLVLIGNPIIPIPDHPRIHHLGFVSDEDKFDAMAAADLLLMPSYFESLSMVALEAWALGKPVLANGRCDVLRGQVVRSNGGLYYESFQEFVEAFRALDSHGLASTLGRQGRDYFNSHYTWPIVEGKYLAMFDRLKQEGAAPRALEPMPGWFARRRRDLPPAAEVVQALPTGPAPRTATGGRARAEARSPQASTRRPAPPSGARRAPAPERAVAPRPDAAPRQDAPGRRGPARTADGGRGRGPRRGPRTAQGRPAGAAEARVKERQPAPAPADRPKPDAGAPAREGGGATGEAARRPRRRRRPRPAPGGNGSPGSK